MGGPVLFFAYLYVWAVYFVDPDPSAVLVIAVALIGPLPGDLEGCASW